MCCHFEKKLLKFIKDSRVERKQMKNGIVFKCLRDSFDLTNKRLRFDESAYRRRSYLTFGHEWNFALRAYIHVSGEFDDIFVEDQIFAIIFGHDLYFILMKNTSTKINRKTILTAF